MNNTPGRIFPFFIVLIIHSFVGLSQNQQGIPFLRNYSPKEYRAHAQNWSIVQGPNGMMYYGNTNGEILEFDGERWRSIGVKNNSIVRSMDVDSKGIIYVGAVDEFGFLKADDMGKLEYQSLVHLLDSSKRHFGNVWKTYAFNNSIYFLTDEGLFKIKNKQVETWSSKTKNYLMSFRVGESIFVQEIGVGLMKLQQNNLRKIPGNGLFKKQPIYVMLPYKQKKILLVTHSRGIYIYDPANGHKFKKAKRFGRLNQYLAKNHPYRGISLDSNRFALGTRLGGVVIANESGAIEQIINKSNGLQGNNVKYIYEDNRQNLHLALDNGLAYAEISSPLTRYDGRNGLEGALLSITRFNGELYTGSTTGIYVLDNNKFQKIEGSNEFGWSFFSFYPPPGEKTSKNDSTLLAGTTNSIYQIKNGKLEKLISARNAFCMLQPGENRSLLFVGMINGVVAYQYRNGQWTIRERLQDIQNEIRNMVRDTMGNIWMGTAFEGIIRMENPLVGDTLNPEPAITHYGKKDGLPDLSWNTIQKINDSLVFGTPKGLYYFNENKEHFYPDSSFGTWLADGIHGVHCMAAGDGDQFWSAAMYPGSSVPGKAIRAAGGNYNWYNLPFKRISEGSIYFIYPENDGICWMGGTEGLYRYNSQIEKKFSRLYPCLLRKISVNKDSVIFWGNAQNHQLINGGELDYSNNNITLEFGAPLFEAQQAIQYSFVLEGEDKSWSSWTQKNRKQYTNLREGEYTFRVKARNIYGFESTTATCAFSIRPPWHRTWWAYSLYTLLAIFLVAGVVRIYTRRLIWQRERLESTVKERTNELEKSNAELKDTLDLVNQQTLKIKNQAEQLKDQNNKLIELDGFKEAMTNTIVHDLKNSLNAILNAPGYDPMAELNMVKCSARQMLTMVLNILDIYKYENSQMEVDTSEYSIYEMAQKAIGEVTYLNQEKNIFIFNDIPPEWYVVVDKDMIIRVLINLLTNAFKYTPEDGSITLYASPLETGENTNGMFTLSVVDTGQGIPRGQLDKVFDKFAQVQAKSTGRVRSTGLGLTYCKMAVEAHGGEIGAESEEGKGSTFWFTLPAKSIPHVNNIPDRFKNHHTAKGLTEVEKSLIKPHLHKLRALMVNETTEILDILGNIEDSSPAIRSWKKQVEDCLFNLDEENYQRLINIT